MKIEQLEQLIKIVECGSMNEAAQALYVARSSLSTSMKRLEEEFGEPIFSRHSTGVSLTPFGAAVYNHACEICSRVRFLQGISKSGGRERLAVASMYCSMANAAFARFIGEHPGESVDASIEESSANQVIESVRDGRCELGILTLFADTEEVTLRRLESEGLEFRAVVKRRIGAIVGPKNPLYSSEKPCIELRELRGFPHLENYATPIDHSWEHRIAPPDGLSAQYAVSDLGLALRLVSETAAVMIDVRDDAIYQGLYAHSDYRFLPIKDYPACRTGWLKSRALPLSPLAEDFIAIFERMAREAD